MPPYQVRDGDERSPTMEAAARLVMTNRTLTTLMLCGNEVSPAGCKALAKVRIAPFDKG